MGPREVIEPPRCLRCGAVAMKLWNRRENRPEYLCTETSCGYLGLADAAEIQAKKEAQIEP